MLRGAELKAKPQPRARSTQELRAKPEPRATLEIKQGRGLWRDSVSPSPWNFLKIHTWNWAIWCIVETKIYLLLFLRCYLLLPVYFGPEQSSGPADPGNDTLYVKQHLLAIRLLPVIRFSPAIRFYKSTFGVIVNNNKHRLMIIIWILEQAADVLFYNLTLPKQLNNLGVGSVKLQSSLFSSHIWSSYC